MLSVSNQKSNSPAFKASFSPSTQESLVKYSKYVGENTKNIIKKVLTDGNDTVRIDMGVWGGGINSSPNIDFEISDKRFPNAVYCLDRDNGEVFFDRLFLTIDDGFKKLDSIDLGEISSKILRPLQKAKNKQAFREKLISIIKESSIMNKNSSSSTSANNLAALPNKAIINLSKLSANKNIQERCSICYDYYPLKVELSSKEYPEIPPIKIFREPKERELTEILVLAVILFQNLTLKKLITT